MKLSLVATMSFGLLAAAAAAACSDDDAPATVTALDAGDDATKAAADAAPLEDARADADAGPPRTCSDEGFCQVPVPDTQDLRGVWGDGNGTVWAVSDEGNVLRGDGSTWTLHVSALGPLRAVWGSGPLDVWVGGDGGLWHGTGTSPATLTFAPVTLPDAGTRIRALWGGSATEVWAVGALPTTGGATLGRVFRYAGPVDGGSGWVRDAVSKLPVAFEAVWGDAKSGVWLAGTRSLPPPDDAYSEAVVLRRRLGTSAFVEQALPPDPVEGDPFGRMVHFGGATFDTDGTLFVFGNLLSNAPCVWRGASPDAGAFTFAFERIGPSAQPRTFAATTTGPKQVWSAGAYGRLRRLDGTGWTQAALTTTKFPFTKDLHALWASPKGELWVVGDGIALRRAEGTTP